MGFPYLFGPISHFSKHIIISNTIYKIIISWKMDAKFVTAASGDIFGDCNIQNTSGITIKNIIGKTIARIPQIQQSWNLFAK